ncbi:MAG: hypothetical protein RMJ66_01860 [Bacteroidia bacterium]|nr:hypothetical protein [Bacteroidia bacterium]MDW8133791.1 hypothetical protein [Bacteroidia bacterium]
MRNWLIWMQIYNSLEVQLPVSPVAYVFSDSLRVGYKVMAELSQGWRGPRLPFWQKESWQLQRQLSVSSNAVLYIEGVVGTISVWQGKRLLFQGGGPCVWVPLLKEAGGSILLRGYEGSGINGGIYLLSRADSIGWPAEPYPEDSGFFCKGNFYILTPQAALTIEGISRTDACQGYPFFPSARVRQALRKLGVCFCILPPSQQGKEPSPVSPHIFFILISLVGLVVWRLPTLREVIWLGWLRPIPTNLIETIIGIVLLGLLSGFLWGRISPFVVGLWGLFLVAEGLFIGLKGGEFQWCWQSWLPLVMVGLVGATVDASFVRPWIIMSWLMRASRLSIAFPDFAYLCAAEVFIYILSLTA